MEINRDRYLKKIISFMWDGQVKVITGIRRCGKSYLLCNDRLGAFFPISRPPLPKVRQMVMTKLLPM